MHCHGSSCTEAIATHMDGVKAIACQSEFSDSSFHCNVDVMCCQDSTCWMDWSKDYTKNGTGVSDVIRSNMFYAANECHARA